MLLIFAGPGRNHAPMNKRLFSFVAASVLALALPAHAACYADYKAKREDPLRLHYGVIQVDISPCTMSDNVKSLVAKRLQSSGWQLLQVQSVFDDGGLGKRKQDAGEFFLRF
jgi:hypothetical protein